MASALDRAQDSGTHGVIRSRGGLSMIRQRLGELRSTAVVAGKGAQLIAIAFVLIGVAAQFVWRCSARRSIDDATTPGEMVPMSIPKALAHTTCVTNWGRLLARRWIGKWGSNFHWRRWQRVGISGLLLLLGCGLGLMIRAGVLRMAWADIGVPGWRAVGSR